MLVLVFLFIFASVALLLAALAAGTDRQAKKTRSRLDAIALGPGDDSAADQEEALVRRKQDVLSSIPRLDRLLHRLDAGRQLRLLIGQADLNWTVGRLLLVSAALGVGGGYLADTRTGSVLLALFFTGLGGALPILYVLHKRRQRFDRLKLHLPEALDLMVAAIRAGHGFASAMGMASKEAPEPLKRELRQCFDEQNFGLDLRVAMSNLAGRVPIREIRMIATAILIQKETGGNLTEILEKVASLIRDDFRLQRQVRVHTAQGRLTGWILALLPVVLGILLYLINPENMSMLWRRPIGVKMLFGAGAMTIAGGMIIRRIVRIQI